MFFRIVFLSLSVVFLAGGPVAFAGESVRENEVAGAFYPLEKDVLATAVDSLLAGQGVDRPDRPAGDQKEHKVLGLIVPHAGYIYSGRVASHAYNAIREGRYDTVIILGPFHRAVFEGASVWSEGAWETPLGEVAVDRELASAILAEDERFRDDRRYHTGEHAIEVQLPFLQRVLGNFSIVPISVSDPSLENVSRLARAMVKASEGRRVLVVASTDMSHYKEDTVAREIDRSTLDFISRGDVAGLAGRLYEGKSELCGQAATLTLLEYARLKKAGLRFLAYDTSKSAFGDGARVVGYGAFTLENPGPGGAAADAVQKESLSAAQKRELLRITRRSIHEHLLGQSSAVSSSQDPDLDRERAVFVTLWKAGELRGCMGHMVPRMGLANAVRTESIRSATSDPRFPPVALHELRDITIDISILTPPQKVGSIDEIDMDRHGVVLSRADGGGVFLPKVWQSTAWTKKRFLSELCSQKAGLEADCWQAPGATLYIFTSYDFGEDEILLP